MHTKGRGKNEDKRRQPGKRYSRIGKLRRLRGQSQGGWKSSRVVGGSGRCQGQIQLLTPENTKTVITETRETADSGPISLSTLLLSPSPRVFFFRAILLHPAVRFLAYVVRPPFPAFFACPLPIFSPSFLLRGRKKKM